MWCGRTVHGKTGDAIQFGSAAGTLVVDPGAVVSGSIVANGSMVDVLDLASGAATGTLTGLGSQFTAFSTVAVDSGATWGVGGKLDLLGGSLPNNGCIAVGAELIVGTDLSSSGNIVSIGVEYLRWPPFVGQKSG